MESYGSAHLPSVDLPASTLSELKDKFSGNVHEIKDDYTTKNVPLDTQNNLMMVRLPETGSSEEKYKRSLATIGRKIKGDKLPKANLLKVCFYFRVCLFKLFTPVLDGIIGKISSELKSSGKPFTALYTAQHNSHVSSDLFFTYY